MIKSSKILKIYWAYAWNYKRYVIPLLLFTPAANITLRILPPLIIATIINKLTNGEFIPGEVWSSFGNEILLFSLAIFGGGFLLWRIVIYLVWKLQGFVERDISRDMFNKYTSLDMSYHANSFGGSLVSRTNKLAGAYIRLQDNFIFNIYLMVVAYTFVSIIMWSKSIVFVFAIWAFSILFVIFSFLITKRVRKLAAQEASAQNKVTGYLADVITNVLTVKSFSSSAYEQAKFNDITEYSRKKTVQVMWAAILRDSFSSIVTSTVSVAAIIIAVIAVVNYGAEVSLVFLIFAYSNDITERLWEFSAQFLRQYNRAIGDAQEGIQTLLTDSIIKDPENPEPLRAKDGNIVFENVTFDHENNIENSALFKKLNLDIKPGEKVGLVGRSGGGKTTITKLIMRFMDINSGVIKIDGQDISKITQDDLRSMISYVPQEPLLFHRSLAENISYANQNSSTDEVIGVAKQAHAHEFIVDTPKGYETLVGERGIKLSGGQRQRIAIARAMIKKAPILILDEATSALDSESEALIQDALWKLMEGKTAIVIAHRLSTIQKLDRILVLDKGKIIEEGNHKELLNKNGTYAKLWAHQSGGFLED